MLLLRQNGVFADFSRDLNAPARDQNGFRHQMMEFLLGALRGSFYAYEICFSSEVFNTLLHKKLIDFFVFFEMSSPSALFFNLL